MKVPYKKCGTKIPPSTSAHTGGLRMPCANKREEDYDNINVFFESGGFFMVLGLIVVSLGAFAHFVLGSPVGGPALIFLLGPTFITLGLIQSIGRLITQLRNKEVEKVSALSITRSLLTIVAGFFVILSTFGGWFFVVFVPVTVGHSRIDIALFLLGILLLLPAIRWPSQSRRTVSAEAEPIDHTEAPPDAKPVAPPSFYKLQTVADYLKLVGMQVSFGTKQDEFFDGEVVDLSDSGTHVVLLEVTHHPKEGVSVKYDKKNIPIADIDWVNVQDRHGKLP